MSPTNWLDERIRLGEIPPGAEDKAIERVGTSEGRRVQAELDLSDASILERLPPERVAARIRSRLEAKSVRRQVAWRSPRVLLPALATLVACAVLAPRLSELVLERESAPVARKTEEAATSPASAERARPARNPARTDGASGASMDGAVAAAETPDDGIRLRGAGELSVFAVAPDGSTAPSGARVEGGTTLRIVVPRAAHAAVWSIDETGIVQRHWPLDGDSSSTLSAGPLPRDWETDPSAGWDRFVFVESPDAFALARVEAHLRGLVGAHRARDGRIVLPAGLAATSVLVERTAR